MAFDPLKEGAIEIFDPLKEGATEVFSPEAEGAVALVEPQADRFSRMRATVDIREKTPALQFADQRPYAGEPLKEAYAWAQNIRDRVVSLGGLLAPDGLMEELNAEARQFRKGGDIIVPMTGAGLELAVEWGLIYPKLFKAAGLANSQIMKIPKVKAGVAALVKMGGVDKLAKIAPRTTTIVKDALESSIKGAEVFGGMEAVGQIQKEGTLGEKAKRVGKAATFGALVTGGFSVVSSADKALYIRKLRKVMQKKGFAQVRQLFQESMAAGKKPSLKTFEDNMLRQIDNVVAAVESDLYGMTKGELYKNIGGKVEAPEKAAVRFLKYGYEPGRPALKGPEILKKGLGVKEPAIKMPTTKAAEVRETIAEAAKAITHPIKTARAKMVTGKPPHIPVKPSPRGLAVAPATKVPAKPTKVPPKAPEAIEGEKLFHGTTESFKPEDLEEGRGLLRKGIYLSGSKKLAEVYGKNVHKFVLSPDAKILDLSDGEKTLDFILKEGILEKDEIDIDLENYILAGRIFQSDPYNRQGVIDDIMATAKDKGFDVVKFFDDLSGESDNIATVVLDKKVISLAPTPTAAKEKIDTAKFLKEAKVEEIMTKSEMGEVEIEPGYQSASKAISEHIGYFENLQLPETSKIRPIQRQIRVINGKRLVGKITPKEANKQIIALRKKLFQTAKNEGISLRMTKGGKVSLSVRQAGTYVPAEFSKYTKFKDIQPLFGGGQDITRAVQQMDGSLTVKQKKMVKGQAGPIERHILWRTRDMSKQKIAFIKEQTIRLQKILKASPNSKADIAVNNVLRGIESGQTFTSVVKKFSQVDEAIVKQAWELRQWYDDMIDDQNAMRELRDQDPIPYRYKYSPEILRDATIWERVSMKDKKPREVIYGVDLPDYIKPNKPFNPRELARDAGIKYEDRVKSAVQLARNYLVTAGKDIFNTSIIQNNKAFIQQLEAMGYDKSSRYLADWTAEAYAGVKPALDRAIKLPKKVERGARKFNQARNIAVFPLNLSWNLTTQPSSLAFTFQKYGIKNTMKGFMDWMKPKIRKRTAENYYSYIVKSSKAGRVTKQDVQNLIGETVKIRKTKGEKLYDIATIIGHEEEKLLTGISIRAAYRHGRAKGLTGKALQEYASDGGGKTQSMYNDEDRPALLRNLGVKTLTPFQTFNFEVVNNLREWAGQTGTPPSSQAERVWQLIRFIVAASIFRMIAKQLANKKIWTWDRLPIPFAEYWLTPLIRTWNKEYTGTPSLPSPVAVLARITKGVRDVYDVGSWRRLRRELLTYGTGYLGIPGGVQLNRTVDALLAYSRGGVYDRRGRLMFEVEDDELKQAIFFGVYSTRGGRKYLEKEKKPEFKAKLKQP